MSKNKLFLLYIAIFALFQGCITNGLAQTPASVQSIFEYLTQETAAKMTLEMDLTTLLANRNSEEYYPALLTLATGKSYQVKVRPKGKYRRKVAEIPPLKVKFPKKTLQEEGLDTLNEFKLVLPCYDNFLGDELVVKEYLIYRMYEHLTPISVRARLVKLTLRDTHVEKSRKTLFAILLEDSEETVARLNGVETEQYGLPVDSMMVNQAALVAMFEYMIGNTDWDVSMMRNVRLIRSNETAKVLLVPYDFDFSGLVSAPYASPSSESGLLTVRDRFLMANGIPLEALRRATRALRLAKDEFYAICQSKYLSREASAQMVEYLDTFYRQIDSKDEVPVRMKVPVSE